MSGVTLKVRIVATGSVGSIQFTGQETIIDACKKINAELAGNQPQVEEYGLLLRTSDPRTDRWLDMEYRVNQFNLPSGSTLDFKKRVRQLRVLLQDGTQKTQKIVNIDESQPLGFLVQSVCKRIGITNHEEYSLVPEIPVAGIDKSKPKADDKKTAELKKKTHTDEDAGWLDHSLTLRQQGIFDDSAALILKKRFFFSDQDINRDDPVQINLLFGQSKESILTGVHPCTLEEALEFAAMQIHIDFGDHNEARHKPGFIDDLRTVLPPEYFKTKGVEKRIYAEHKKLVGQSEINVKYNYIKKCRSLKTYGITFFLVKEKVKGKNKLMPMLLGITRESAMRMDPQTKEVLKTFPLTTVRRWAASPNSFTLDFGDYADSYYSVQSSEGDAISQLIAGYIDIILKKKAKQDKREVSGAQGTEEVVEEAQAFSAQRQSVKVGHAARSGVAAEAQIVSVSNPGAPPIPGRVAGHASISGSSSEAQAAMMGAQRAKLRSASGAQTALLGNIQFAQSSLTGAGAELAHVVPLPPIGSDPASIKWRQDTLAVSRQNLSAQVAAIAASTASVITLSSKGPGGKSEVNYTAVGAAVTTLSSNIQELVKNAQMIAALSANAAHGDRVLAAGRGLAGALGKFLNVVVPIAQGENSNRQDVLTEASSVGAASAALLDVAGESHLDQSAQEAVQALAKNVAQATAVLINSAKTVASKCDDPALQANVISDAKAAALATSQLVTCTKIVASSMDHTLCQEQVVESARQVADAVAALVSNAQNACKDQVALQQLGEAAHGVTNSLSDLITRIRDGSLFGKARTKMDDAVEAITAATESIKNATGDPQEIVRQAKILATAASALVAELKNEAAKESDPEKRNRYLDAAKALAEHTQNMVAAAKRAAQSPNDAAAQEALLLASTSLREATNAAAGNAVQKRVVTSLELAASQAASIATQLIAAAQGSNASNRNKISQQQLVSQCKMVSSNIVKLVAAIKAYKDNPDSPAAQMGLINECKAILVPAQKMLAAAKAAAPTISDTAAAMQLTSFSKSTASAMTELRNAVRSAQDACASLELDSALDSVVRLGKELGEIESVAAKGQLILLPGESAESASLELGVVSKTVSASVAQLLNVAYQNNEELVFAAARDTSAALAVLAGAVRGVAAGSKDPRVQQTIVANARSLMQQVAQLMSEVKTTFGQPEEAKKAKLAGIARTINAAMNQIIDCLPGQHEVGQAIKDIQERTAALKISGAAPAGDAAEYQKRQQALNTAAGNLNLAASALVNKASRGTPAELASAAKNLDRAHATLMQAGMDLASVTSAGGRDELLSFLKGLSASTQKLLLSGRALAADPNTPNMREQLASAVRGLTGSINLLIDTCTSSAPGQKECETAIRNIQAGVERLEQPSAPVSDASFFACLDAVMQQSKRLGMAMSQIATTARERKNDEFCVSVNDAADSVVQLTGACAQAAYLLAISDPTSQAGEAGLIDTSNIARAQEAIRSACSSLLSPHSSQQDILTAAKTIADSTSALCQLCKGAASATQNSAIQRQFVACTKAIASATSNMVTNIKSLASDNSAVHRKKCEDASEPLLAAVDNLLLFASSPDIASKPAVISQQAREAQVPLTTAGRAIVDSSCGLIGSAKALIVNPKDPPTWQELAAHSKAVSDGIKGLVAAIRDRAPGQAECDTAIFNVNKQLHELDEAEYAATQGSLDPRAGDTLESCQEQLMETTAHMVDLIRELMVAAKSQPVKLGHAVQALENQFEQLVSNIINASSTIQDSTLQNEVLEQGKTILESALQFLYAARESGGNSQATDKHLAVDETANNMLEALKEFTNTVGSAAAKAGVVSGNLAALSTAVERLDQEPDLSSAEPGASFVQYQQDMTDAVKGVAQCAQDMMGKALADPTKLGGLAQEMTQNFVRLAESARSAMSTADGVAVSMRLRQALAELSEACADQVQAGGLVQNNPGDAIAKRELAQATRAVVQKVSLVTSALQAGSRGTQACISAIESIDSAIVDLETTAMFASAGSLQSDGEQFAEHREEVLTSAMALVENTKQLVAAAAASQDVLLSAAEAALATFSNMSSRLKRAAIGLGSVDTQAQVLLLNAAQAVGQALTDLLNSTKNASGKSVTDGSMDQLKSDAKGMVTTVSSLLKTVKSIEDDKARGVRALESAIESIDHEASSADLSNVPKSAENVVQSTRLVANAVTRIVAALGTGKPEDLTEAANSARKGAVEMMKTVKAAVKDQDLSGEVRVQTTQAADSCAQALKALLEHGVSLKGKPAGIPEKKKALDLSRNVALAISNLSQCAENLKGEDWVDPSDPNVMAEQELLAAANAIDSAAKKLATLAPRPEARAANEDLPFEEQILEAAKSIAAATSSLVKAASQAQKELVQSGALKKVSESGEAYHQDSEWSAGLISAAKLVAVSTEGLCEAANAAVQGGGTDTKLIASAKGVAKSTAQLLVACKISESSTPAMKRLQVAGAAVKKAADNLVKAAQESSGLDDEGGVDMKLGDGLVKNFAQEIAATEMILKQERELEMAKRTLAKIRASKYKRGAVPNWGVNTVKLGNR